jgi:iron complex outermembrane receptor protein
LPPRDTERAAALPSSPTVGLFPQLRVTLREGQVMTTSRAYALIGAMVFTAEALAAQIQPAGITRDSASGRAVNMGAVEVVGSPTGQGRSRTLTAISASVAREVAAPGTSALKVIERLPGVNFQSADPWGTYEWSNRVTIRGFQPGQIGQTFDGIPLGDMSYGNHNGLGIGRAVDPDNLEGTSVAQGSGALATSSNNNLGGVIQYYSADPRNDRAFQIRQMAGEAAARRTFLRFDNGLWNSGDNALKAFVSYSRMDNDKWKGSGIRYSPANDVLFGSRGIFGTGEVYQDQLNAKLVFLRGAHKLTAFYDLADRKEADYTDLSLARFNASGRDWDQFSDWNTAKQFASSSTPDEAYFHSAIGWRRDHLAYVSGEMQLTERARLVVTPYMHTNLGQGDWHAPSYGSSWSPDAIYFRQTQYDNKRAGVNTRFKADLGASNELEAGAWFESSESTIRRVGWRLKDFATGPDVDFATVLRLFFDRTGTLTTTMGYVQNTTTLMSGDLRLIYGAKLLHVGAEFENNGLTIPSAMTAPDVNRPSFSVPTDGGILPQVGAVYSVTKTEELFANASQNVNAYPYSPQSGVYNMDPSAFQFFKDNTKPEKANTYELGVRTRRGPVEASLAAYNIDYNNRLISVAVCPLTATCVSSFANVGSITSRGAEGMLVWRLTRSVQWMSSGSYTHATIDDDYRSGSTTIAASGKNVIDVPKVILSSTLRYDDARFFANAGVRHVGERFFSILNDMKVPAYTVTDVGAGYRLGTLGAAKELTLQLNVANLFDEKYISTMGTGGFTVSGDSQTLQAGAKRLVFLTLGAAF